MPTMKPKDLIRLLEKDGWEYVPSNGDSHQKYKKGTQTITIPYHNKDLPTGLFMKIMKITGLKSEGADSHETDLSYDYSQ